MDPPAPAHPLRQLGELVAGDRRTCEAIERLERVAATDLPLLIQGETGTGKELAARAVHEASPRAAGPLVVCDVATLAPTLIESELFGHVRGSFTGATMDRRGAFELAHGGTIFLDEIGELDLALQPRLLRALERKEVKPIGAAGYRQVDVRVIAATNRDLAAEVQARRFRPDLYHRLAVARVALPPLRERTGDLPALAAHILARVCAPMGLAPPALAPDALACLRDHDWPGNVRELRNVLERALAAAPGARVIDAAMIELDPRPAGTAPTGGGGARGARLARGTIEPPVDLDLPFKQAKERIVAEWERAYVRALLERYDGNVSSAARRAGIDRVHLHRLIKKLGLG
jgi:DNA-binding NtrC family response regulator